MSEFDLNKVTLLGTDEEEEPIVSPLAQTVEDETMDDGFDLSKITPPDDPSEDFKIDQALQQSPDTHKRNREIAESTGVPQDVVERDDGGLERVTKANELRSDVADSPALKKYMLTGKNAETIHDDIKELSKVEEVFKQYMPDLHKLYEIGEEGYRGLKKSAIGTLSSMHVAKGESLVQQGQDVGRSFWEIIRDESLKANPVGLRVPGTDLFIPTAFDVFNGLGRFEQSRVYGDASEEAKAHFKTAKRLSDVAASMEMSPTSKRSYDALSAAFAIEGDWADKADAVMAAMASDPVGLLNMAYEVFMESSVPLIAGAGVSMATGNPLAGASTMVSLSGARERFSTENLAKTGTDLSKEADIDSLVSDPEKLQKARKFGQERMLPIMLLDAASMGLAGKALSETPGVNAALQSLYGGILGGLGEAFAQKGSEGEITDPLGVFLEFIVEVASAPLEIHTANTGDNDSKKMGNFNVTFSRKSDEVQGKIDRSEQDEKLMKDVSKAIANTKTKERDPKVMKDITKGMADKYGTDTVYLKPEAVEKLLQSSSPTNPYDKTISPDDAGPEISEEIENNPTIKKILEDAPGAIERGEMIEVPIAEYMVDIGSNENFGDKFNQHASFKNNGLTPAERSDDAIQEEIDRAAEEDALAIQEQNEEEIVRQDLVQHYVDAGMDQSIAEAETDMHMAVYKSVASRDDLNQKTVASIHKEWKGTTQMQLDGDVQEALKKIDNFDVLLDNIREENYPTTSEIYGESAAEFMRREGGVSEKYSPEVGDADTDSSGKKKRKSHRIFQEKGIDIDVMGAKLVDAGYLVEADPNAVLELIRSSESGNEAYLGEADPVKQEMLNNMEYVEGILGNAGIDIRTATNEEIRQAVTATNKNDVDWLSQQVARKNNIGLYSAVERVAVEMDLPAWKKKKGDPFTPEMEERHAQLEEELERLWVALANKNKSDESFDPRDSTEGQDILNGPTKAEYDQLSKSKSDPKASGKEIWAKIKSSGVKKEEYEWLGLEEYLTMGGGRTSSKEDIQTKFTRKEVVEFIRQKGVRIVENVGDQEGSDADYRLEWDEGRVWDDSEAWYGEVSDSLYEFVHNAGDYGGIDIGEWMRGWMFQNIDQVIDNYRARLPEDTMKEVEEAESSSSVLTESGQAVLDILHSSGYDVEQDMRQDARDDFEEHSEEVFRENYFNDPMYIYESTSDSSSENFYIFGNDDVGYDITTGGFGGNGNRIYDDTEYSLDQAQMRANDYARDYGLLEGHDEEDTSVAKWGDPNYNMEGNYENYRENKLTLPDVEGDFHESMHEFPDRNIVAFLRVDDRDLAIGEPTTPSEPSDDDWAIRKMQGEEGSDETFGELDEWLQGRISKFRMIQAEEKKLQDQLGRGEVAVPEWKVKLDSFGRDKELLKLEIRKTEERIRNAWTGYQSRRSSEVEKKTYFIDEFQSDWHQQGRQKGYKTGVDAGELEAESQRRGDVLDDKLQSIFNSFTNSGDEIAPIIELEAAHQEKFSIGSTTFNKLAYETIRNDGNKLESENPEAYSRKIHNAKYEFVAKAIADSDIDVPAFKKEAADVAEMESKANAERYGVPDAPFKKDGWMSLGLKRAVVDAVENGYEAIAWPNVEVLVDRWHENYRQLYTKQYQEKMPSIMKKITGQKPVHMDLDGNEVVLGGDGLAGGWSVKEIKTPEGVEMFDQDTGWVAVNEDPQKNSAMIFKTKGEAVAEARGYSPIPEGYYIVELTDEFKKKVMEEGLTLYQKGGAKSSDVRGYYIPSQKRTVYTESHNLSTYIHEPGHKFLEMMRSMSHRSKSIAKDLAEFDKWAEKMGASKKNKNRWKEKFDVHKARIIKQGKVPESEIDSVAAEAATNEVKHEMFASGIETYFMEGKAPTVELEPLFSRFRAWLIHVYKRILKSSPFKSNNLSDVEMTDEIRGVFDRLVATDDAIEQSKGLQGHKALPVDSMGLNPKLVEDYQLKFKESKDQAKTTLMAKIMGELSSQQSKEFKGMVKKHLEDIQARDEAQENYKIRNGITGGVLPKLDYEAVKFLVGKEKAQYLSRAGLTKKGGVDPDVLATGYSYSSGSRMLTDLHNTKGKGDLKKQQKLEAIQKAEIERGDIYQTGGIDEAALEIVHSEKNGRLHAMELQILNSMLPGGFVTQPTANEMHRRYKASAEQAISETPINKLNPGFHKSNQQKHNNDVVRFSTQGKFAEAREAKHKALRQFHLYNESMKAKEQADRHAKYARSFKGGKWKRVQRSGDHYISQINGILQKFEFKAVSQKAIVARQNMTDWINKIFAEAGEGNPTSHHDTLTKDQKLISKQEEQEDTQKIMSDHGITDAMMADAETVNYKTLTPVELQAVIDSLRTIDNMSKLKDKLFSLGDKRSLREAIDELVAEIESESTSTKKKSLGSTKEGKQERKERLKSFIDMSKSPTGFIKMLGGYKQGSLAWKLLGQPLRDAASMETDQINKANIALEEIFMRSYSKKDWTWLRSSTLSNLNRKIYDERLDVDLTKHDVISFLLNWGNEEGRNRVMDGHGLAEEDVMYLFDKYLDEKDHNFAKDMWAYVGTFKKAAFDLHRDMFGFTPEEVLPVPFETKYGVMPGGYYPISYDKAKSAAADQHAMTKTTDSFRRSISSKSEMGSNKSRVKRVFRPLETDIVKVAYSHISEVIHKTTHTRALYDVGRLLANDEVKGAITDAYGEHAYKYITESVRDIHDGSEGVKDIYDRFALFIRNNATLSMLAFSVRTIALQPFGVTNSIVKARLLGVGSKKLFKAYTKYSLHPINESRIAMEESIYMAGRPTVMSTAISRIKNMLKNRGSFDKIKESGMIPIMKTQFYTVDMPLYIAVRDHFIPVLGREGAIKEGEQAVIDAQGGGNIMDTPRAMMGGSYRKMWTNFLSYMMATYTLQSENYDKTFRKHDQNIFDFSVNTFVALTVPAILMTMLNAIQSWDPDDEDLLDTVKDEFSDKLWREQISFLMGTNTYSAQFSGALMGYDYQGPQGTAIISKIIKLAEQSYQGEMDEAWARAAITAFGLATGLPSSQTNRIVFGAKQAIEGGESPLSVVKKAMLGKTYND